MLRQGLCPRVGAYFNISSGPRSAKFNESGKIEPTLPCEFKGEVTLYVVSVSIGCLRAQKPLFLSVLCVVYVESGVEDMS